MKASHEDQLALKALVWTSLIATAIACDDPMTSGMWCAWSHPDVIAEVPRITQGHFSHGVGLACSYNECQGLLTSRGLTPEPR